MFPKIGFYLATKRFVLPPRLLIHLKCHVQLRWNSVLNFKTSGRNSRSCALSCGLFPYLYHLESSLLGACSLAWKFPATTTLPLKCSYLLCVSRNHSSVWRHFWTQYDVEFFFICKSANFVCFETVRKVRNGHCSTYSKFIHGCDVFSKIANSLVVERHISVLWY
jgi:hypothetical protein